MVNLKEVYKNAEENTSVMIVIVLIVLGLLILAQTFFSPVLVLTFIVVVITAVLTAYRPLWTLAALSVYLPFEPFILKFTPDSIFVFTRLFSEFLIYLLALVTIGYLLTGRARLRQTPINLPFVLLLIVLISSAVINFVPAFTASLGIRQIIRFMIVFFVVVNLHPPKRYIKRLTATMFAIVIFQSSLGLSQAVIGQPLDEFLLPAEARTYGEITLTTGVDQFWDAGSRIFATMGRYDILGNFLYIFLIMGVAFLYEPRFKSYRKHLTWMFALGMPAILLTFSRASWFAFLIGFIYIGLLIKRDKRIALALASVVILIGSYLAVSGLNVRFITEAPGQTLAERFFESFSYSRWRGEYFGLGRTFWMVQTPMVVFPASPFFGFGPGQYGGGVAAALKNTTVYDDLGLPFGVFGTGGFIDNNWFSLLGEIGLFGMVFFIWILVALYKYARKLYDESSEVLVRTFAISWCAIVLAVSFNAILSTSFEIRTVGFYLWMYAGFVVVLGERTKKKKSIKLGRGKV